MALLEDVALIRQELTYVLPSALIIDFYSDQDTIPIEVIREFYGEDTVDETF